MSDRRSRSPTGALGRLFAQSHNRRYDSREPSPEPRHRRLMRYVRDAMCTPSRPKYKVGYLNDMGRVELSYDPSRSRPKYKVGYLNDMGRVELSSGPSRSRLPPSKATSNGHLQRGRAELSSGPSRSRLPPSKASSNGHPQLPGRPRTRLPRSQPPSQQRGRPPFSPPPEEPPRWFFSSPPPLFPDETLPPTPPTPNITTITITSLLTNPPTATPQNLHLTFQNGINYLYPDTANPTAYDRLLAKLINSPGLPLRMGIPRGPTRHPRFDHYLSDFSAKEFRPIATFLCLPPDLPNVILLYCLLTRWPTVRQHMGTAWPGISDLWTNWTGVEEDTWTYVFPEMGTELGEWVRGGCQELFPVGRKRKTVAARQMQIRRRENVGSLRRIERRWERPKGSRRRTGRGRARLGTRLWRTWTPEEMARASWLDGSGGDC
ncbi:hypothetical protein QBC39DRAFT_326073 [Podospora conica]|nr:hypothetical protein QBC39DRAFT_326073 [Schizothecium conicum]